MPTWSTPARRRAVRHGLIFAGLLVFVLQFGVRGDTTWQRLTSDGLVYWGVELSDLYSTSMVGLEGSYLYSPAFAQVFAIIGLLPSEVFAVLWTGLLAATALWLARPWPPSLLVLALPVSHEVLLGNIHLLLAAAIVLGFRWPGTWSFVILTKITPGIGLVWFAVRREWRYLAIALVTTGVIFAISFAMLPDAWRDWIAFLYQSNSGAPQFVVGGVDERHALFPIRIVIAGVIAAWGGRTGQAWVVPLAAMLALPVVWMSSLSMLLGCVALSGRRSSASEAQVPRVAGAA